MSSFIIAIIISRCTRAPVPNDDADSDGGTFRLATRFLTTSTGAIARRRSTDASAH